MRDVVLSHVKRDKFQDLALTFKLFLVAVTSHTNSTDDILVLPTDRSALPESGSGSLINRDRVNTFASCP